jgi:GDP-L-fucose synthase
MNKDSKIYISGHTGLAGAAFSRKLKSEGYTDLIFRRHDELDLTRQADVEDFFSRERPEYVFIAAAKVGGILANNNYPAEFIYSNLTIQTNVLHCAWKNNVKRLIFLGSSCIYPRECPQPMKEEYLLSGPLEPTNQSYAIAKISGVLQCEAYNRQYGTRFLSVMPTNLFGPNDRYDLQNSHVLPALIRKFHLARLAREERWEEIGKDEKVFGPIPDDIKETLGLDPLTNRPLGRPAFNPKVILWGTGTVRREFLYVDDLADACLFLMEMPENQFVPLLSPQKQASLYPSPLINIGYGEDLTIRDLAESIAEVVGFQGDIYWDKSKPDGVPRKLLDVAMIHGLGWRHKTPLKQGIRKAYEWYLKN